jgi:Subtilase family
MLEELAPATLVLLRPFANAENSVLELVLGPRYPSNMSDSIYDPAQAWNALTVGGYTDKIAIDGVKWPGWEPLAARGDLSPSSCTSMTWGRWPIKPDIVMEAGNLATNTGRV